MSDFAVFQHDRLINGHTDDCQTAADVLARAKLTQERRKASVVRLIKPTKVLELTEELHIEPTTYPVKEIQMAVCRAEEIGFNELISTRRSRREMLPRSVAIILCLSLTQYSISEIARRFGGMNHTSLLYIRDKMEGLSREISSLLEDVPLHYLVRIALEYTHINYFPPPVRRSRAKVRPLDSQLRI